MNLQTKSADHHVQYISQEEYRELRNKSEEVGRTLNHMVKNPEKYRPK